MLALVPDTPDPLAIRSQIDDLEARMFAAPQVAIETRHYYADGLYAREITIPAGVLLTGKIHAREHINIVSKGCIDVLTEGGARRIEAPATFVSPPGTKRVGFTHAETVWTTLHANEGALTDPDALEAVLLLPCHPEGETPCLS